MNQNQVLLQSALFMGACVVLFMVITKPIATWLDKRAAAKDTKEDFKIKQQVNLTPGAPEAWRDMNEAAGRLLAALNKKSLTFTVSNTESA